MCISVCWSLLATCVRWWLVMDGSSESGWHRSDNYRGLNSNSSSFLDRTQRILRGRSSGDNTSNDSGFVVSARKGREKTLWPQTNHYRARDGDGVTAECEEVSLRQWLDNPERKVDALDCVHIFSQIAEIVNRAHSHGIILHNVRPSCFTISSFNSINFVEAVSNYSESGADSLNCESNSQMAEFKRSSSPSPSPSPYSGIQLETQHSGLPRDPSNGASQVMNSDTSCLQSWSGPALHSRKERRELDRRLPCTSKQTLLLEPSWYMSPEEAAGGPISRASDVYQLGMLLFELFYAFSSLEEKSTTMASLRHRVLPPQMLLTWPKQTSFCLWLLHPEPSCRPTMSELLDSEFLNEPRDDIEERVAALELREKIEEQELLLEFLLLLQQRKQDVTDGLNETISCISSDIEEVTNMQKAPGMKNGSNVDPSKNSAAGPHSMNMREEDDSGYSGSRKRVRKGLCIDNSFESNNHLDVPNKSEAYQASVLSKNTRLMKNFRKFESAYFLTRRRAAKPSCGMAIRPSPISSSGKGSIVATERSSISNSSLKARGNEVRQRGWVNTFLEGLSKYLSYSTLKVKANLKQGDLLSSSNLVCSLSFDRDGEFFATAGVNKKIKVFDFNSISSEERDIHYPVVEMSSKSKFSSICWNGYIKSQIASSNFDGVVQVWDVSRNQTFIEMKEHERRVWSVDFSVADPTLLASGSDDGSVKLWNINQGSSLGTIKTKANICCVQFPPDSGRSLAFGSADHKIYYYDLRNSKMPLCTLIGHNKTVSYVKFIDSTTLVSASTDNTLKIWDLSMSTSRVLDSPLQSFTGHLNVKNFVGLSVSEGYIATGSETNEVFVYHKAFPMPVLSFKFNSTDPLSGDEVDDTAQFISSVCWRGQSSTLVAANSMGNIKLMEMA